MLLDDLADHLLAVAAQVHVGGIEVVEAKVEGPAQQVGVVGTMTPKLISGIFRPVRPRTRYEISGAVVSCPAASLSGGMAREHPVSPSPADTTPVAAPPMNLRLLTPLFFIVPPPSRIARPAIEGPPESGPFGCLEQVYL